MPAGPLPSIGSPAGGPAPERPSARRVTWRSVAPSKWTCLVTGGAGFIGSHLAERLVQLGHHVRVTDDFSTGIRDNLVHLDGQLELLEGDLTDPGVCEQAVEQIDVVFHLAALASVPRSLTNPWATHDANVNATLHLIRASQAAGVRRLVYASSSSVYGDMPTLPKTESAEALPRSPYAAAKLAGEQYVLAYARGGLLNGVALRYFNVFGPRQNPHSPYAAVVPAFLKAALWCEPAMLFGDGGQTRDFTYVDDVVTANVLAASAPADLANGMVINIGGGRRTSLLALLQLIMQVTGREVKWERRPAREGDVRDSLASLDRAERILGYRPQVALDEGLKRTWNWLRSTV